MRGQDAFDTGYEVSSDQLDVEYTGGSLYLYDSRAGSDSPYEIPRSAPAYLSGPMTDAGWAPLGSYISGTGSAEGFGFIPSTNAMTAHGLPTEEVFALFNRAQNLGPDDGVSQTSTASPTSILVTLAAAGRNPTDITLPTVGSQGGGGDEEDDAVAASSGTTDAAAGPSSSSASVSSTTTASVGLSGGGSSGAPDPAGESSPPDDGGGPGSDGSHLAPSAQPPGNDKAALAAFMQITDNPARISPDQPLTTSTPAQMPRCMACHGTGVSSGQAEVWELPEEYQWSIMRATGTTNPADAQIAIDGGRTLATQFRGGLRAVGGGATTAFGAAISSTGVGAAAGVPLAAWGADQLNTGVQEAKTGQEQTSFGGRVIQRAAGTGPRGQVLTFAYDTVPGMVAVGAAARIQARAAATEALEAAELEPAIPGATRLSEAEQATAARLQAQTGLTLKESEHVGSEYVDELGRTYDQMGNPKTSQFWNEKSFLGQIDKHLLKSNDFTVIDLTGFTEAQITTVRNYVNSLPAQSQAKIKRIGF